MKLFPIWFGVIVFTSVLFLTAEILTGRLFITNENVINCCLNFQSDNLTQDCKKVFKIAFGYDEKEIRYSALLLNISCWNCVNFPSTNSCRGSFLRS